MPGTLQMAPSSFTTCNNPTREGPKIIPILQMGILRAREI